MGVIFSQELHIDVPYGLCGCGCGQETPVSKKTNARRGHIKGRRTRFCHGHSVRYGQTDQERFMAKVEVQGSGCWFWTANLNRWGYGTFCLRGKMFLAHRASWMLLRGEIPDGMHVLHTCDKPGRPEDISYRRCVWPEHLYLGIEADNMRDKIQRGRCRSARMFGKRNPQTPFTEADVRAILLRAASGETQRSIANSYGVWQMTICNIARGKTWCVLHASHVAEHGPIVYRRRGGRLAR